MNYLKRRVLGQRTRCAHTEHYCDSCEHRIFPGDLYEVTVTLFWSDVHRSLNVRKEHVHPGCPYPDPTEDEDAGTCFSLVELPLAA